MECIVRGLSPRSLSSLREAAQDCFLETRVTERGLHVEGEKPFISWFLNFIQQLYRNAQIVMPPSCPVPLV